MRNAVVALIFALLCTPLGAQEQPTEVNTLPAKDEPATEPLPQGPLIVGIKAAPPFVIDTGDGQFEGISVALWERIAASLGRDIEYRLESLQGLLDGVESGRFDAGVGAITVTGPREERIDFTHPFFDAGLGIAVRADQGGGWLAVVGRVFSLEFLQVLLALGGLLLLCGALVWLFERRRNPEQFGGRSADGIGSGFWWAAVTMTTVGYGDKAPVTLGGRLVALVWMFAAIIVISTFTAQITSSLTIGELSGRVNGPGDLESVRVASLPDSTSAEWLDRNGIAFSNQETLQAALGALAAGRVDAVVYDEPLLRYWIREDHQAALRVLPSVFEPQRYAFALPEDSALREPLNRALLEEIDQPTWTDELVRYLGNPD